jgi:hypothetical protein
LLESVLCRFFMFIDSVSTVCIGVIVVVFVTRIDDRQASAFVLSVTFFVLERNYDYRLLLVVLIKRLNNVRGHIGH